MPWKCSLCGNSNNKDYRNNCATFCCYGKKSTALQTEGEQQHATKSTPATKLFTSTKDAKPQGEKVKEVLSKPKAPLDIRLPQDKEVTEFLSKPKANTPTMYSLDAKEADVVLIGTGSAPSLNPLPQQDKKVTGFPSKSVLASKKGIKQKVLSPSRSQWESNVLATERDRFPLGEVIGIDGGFRNASVALIGLGNASYPHLPPQVEEVGAFLQEAGVNKLIMYELEGKVVKNVQGWISRHKAKHNRKIFPDILSNAEVIQINVVDLAYQALEDTDSGKI